MNLSKKVAASLLVSVLALSGCGSSSSSSSAKKKIIVGSKNFTENEILAEVYSLALEDHGYKVERKFDISSNAVHTAITSNKIDLYPGYTGTAYFSILKHTDTPSGDVIYKKVKQEYKKKFNLDWLAKSPAEDSQALAVSKRVSDKYHIKTISDLQKNASKLRFISQGEFEKRADGLVGLAKVYGKFNFKSIKIYDNSLKYQILDQNKGDVIPAYTSDGALTSSKYVVLKDNKKFWPDYNIAPIVRNSVYKKYSDLGKILDPIDKKLTTKKLQQLNRKVDIDKKDYQDVAKDYYNSQK